MSREDALADQLKIDYTKADLTARERAMLDVAHKLTAAPSTMREDDVRRLREHGFEDLAILHVVLLTGLFNYLNRVADGLGIELDRGVWESLCRHEPIPWQEESGSRPPEGGR